MCPAKVPQTEYHIKVFPLTWGYFWHATKVCAALNSSIVMAKTTEENDFLQSIANQSFEGKNNSCYIINGFKSWLFRVFECITMA